MKTKSFLPIAEGIGKAAVENANLLRRLVSQYGSPVHLVFPDAVKEQVTRMKSIFRKLNVKGQIYYGAKANKSDVFLEVAAHCGIGVDISSREEMVAALAAGVLGRNLMATGPHKPSSLQSLLVLHSACIAMDSLAELKLLKKLTKGLQKKAKIVLRFRPETEKNSRFGMSHAEILDALQFLDSTRDDLRLIGFSFHLSGYDIRQRAEQGLKLIEYCALSKKAKFEPKWIDLGGGWPVSYIDATSWQNYLKSMRPADFHAGRTPKQVYPYHQSIAGPDALQKCLEIRIRGKCLAEACKENDISIAIEPGRMLLDQAGLSIFKVIATKYFLDAEYGVATVQGQSFSLSEQWFGSEFLPEPFLISGCQKSAQPFYACIAGSSCLDADLLSFRKIPFRSEPMAGDLIVYYNTAGYQMDSNETMFHRLPLPKKVAVWKRGGKYFWIEDFLFHQSDYFYSS